MNTAVVMQGVSPAASAAGLDDKKIDSAMDSTLENLTTTLERQSTIAGREIAIAPRDGRATWAAISPSTAAPLVSALRAVPVIAALEGQWYALPNEGELIRFEAVAIYLLERAQRIAAQTIVVDLMRIAKSKSITFVETRLIVGITPTRVVDLGDGFSLVPPAHAPSADHSALLFSDQNRPRHGWGGSPTGALVRKSNYDLRLKPPPEENMLSPVDPVTSERDWQAALLASALASDASPQFRQHYYLVEDPGWLGMRSNGFSASESFPIPETHATFFDEAVVAGLFQKLRSENKTIDLAINRLVSSRRRLSLEESALDLGTCIEVLLMSGSKDNAEISYKIATRAAWLVGTDPDDRKRCYKIARNLYADRSAAAHTGSLTTLQTMDQMNAQVARLRESDDLCVRLINALLDRGVPKAEHWQSIVLDSPM